MIYCLLYLWSEDQVHSHTIICVIQIIALECRAIKSLYAIRVHIVHVRGMQCYVITNCGLWNVGLSVIEGCCAVVKIKSIESN
uniref:Uncharacterized protein n=1 Tax=Candidatus Methanophaga sp. ANME-1 ERB7 TaxID=2759913 RepID=A0A7G9Z406_9EURY|nr:hypothetical protein KIHMDPCI_00001 [Methanosarcinales archaeon ANME-1 ERB7]